MEHRSRQSGQSNQFKLSGRLHPQCYFCIEYNLYISFPLRLIYVVITAVCGAPKIREISFSKCKGSANHKESSSVRKKNICKNLIINYYIDAKKMCILEESADDHSPSSSLKDYKAVTLRF